MKAFVMSAYGAPESLTLTDLPHPVPGPGEVVVRVLATSVQPYDWHLMRGQPYVARIMPGGPGLRRPTITVLGADVAGRVEAVGRDVTRFAVGDEVYGMPKRGGFAEYACVPEGELVPKPRTLSFEQAAAVPMAALTAIIAVKHEGRVAAGQRVLVNGASGGVGTFAVQLARAYGAAVTAVCGSRNAELLAELGAEEVISYTEEDFTRQRGRYDLLVDVSGGPSAGRCRRALTREGTYVAVGGPAGRWLQPAGHVFAALAAAPFVKQRIAQADVVRWKENRRDLLELTGLIERGAVTPVIDRIYPFADLPAAVAYQERGHASGKVVVSMLGDGADAPHEPGAQQGQGG
ncbi:MAG: NAD(P)-dependent alcohol dehydrogenase [Nonomuraea sp.]|nr:NAD(P)-dependent alcohol dehydrogenase [Nonomuraea sp.]